MSKSDADLMDHVLGAYAAHDTVHGQPMRNDDLYRAVSQRAGLDESVTQVVEPVGRSGQPRNLFFRQCRWHQQTLKALGLIERVTDARGMWKVTDKAKSKLRPILAGWHIVAFSTDLGLTLWSSTNAAVEALDETVMLAFTSPPYPLARERAYGNVDARAYVDWLCSAMAPIVDKLSPEGSLVLNLSNDIFEPGSPARSTYLERVTLAMEDELGLFLMDRLVWHNPSKPPGPMQWASRTRQQLNVAYEPILWFAKDPHRVKSNNRRVLEDHSKRQQQLIDRGGENRNAIYGDGAYRLRHGSYSKPTEGRIPRNVIRRGHRCAWGGLYRERASAMGLPLHGAGMPYTLPEFFINFLTAPGDLVLDRFAGRSMTGRAAESLGRRWLCIEQMLEYAVGGSTLFIDEPGYDAPLTQAMQF